jgi:peptidylprolyl isomerase
MSLTKPELSGNSGTAPTELVIEDLVVGTGEEAKPGDAVEVHS